MDKGGDISLIGLAHAQKLPVNFVLMALMVKDKGGDQRDEEDGEDGDFPSPRGFFFPCHSFGLALFCVQDICPVVGISCEGHEDQTVALLTVIEEGHLREEKGACSKSRGKRELLNLECTINFET
jgi:hypothetical protein